MGLIVFILLLCFHPWLLRIHGKHFQPVYLVFLVIPVTYYFLSNIGLNEKPKEQKDLFYFSIRTTHPALVELKDAGATIASWQLNSSGYKYLQYSGNPINNATGLSLSINNLAASDTLSLLSANVFHDNQLYSLYKDHASQCLITNAALISMSGALDAVVHSSGKPVGISLPSFYAWHTTHPANNLRIYLILAFILVLVIVLVLAPTMKRFLISCSLAWVLMILAYWATNYMYYEVGMQTGCPVTNVQFFYNNHPSFDRFKNIELNLCATFFRSEINLSDNNYLRCDINESEKVLKHFHVITKAGYLQNDMDFGHIPPDKMLLNDMTFSHGSFIITGDDPFFCLTSSYFTGHLQWLLIMHKNLYLLISLGVIILILIFDPNRFPIRKEKKL